MDTEQQGTERRAHALSGRTSEAAGMTGVASSSARCPDKKRGCGGIHLQPKRKRRGANISPRPQVKTFFSPLPPIPLPAILPIPALSLPRGRV